VGEPHQVKECIQDPQQFVDCFSTLLSKVQLQHRREIDRDKEKEGNGHHPLGIEGDGVKDQIESEREREISNPWNPNVAKNTTTPLTFDVSVTSLSVMFM
jgi:hypothetical protein